MTVITERFYLLGSRPLTHVSFWLLYYLTFSLIWMKPEQGYFGSFFLEFILLPARLLAVYGMIYVLMPRYLLTQRFRWFFAGYASLLILAGAIQLLAHYFFYQKLFLDQPGKLWDITDFIRAVLLVNSTVIFVGAIRLLQLYLAAAKQLTLNERESRKIAIKANRKTHLINCDDILFIEGMGNYVSYHLTDGRKLVAHGSIKASMQDLSDDFVRTHRSYVVNRNKIDAYNGDEIFIAEHALPRSKDVPNELLMCIT